MLRTERLLLRNWKDSDYAPFAAMNADPQVMEFFPKLLTREESDAMIDRIRNGIQENGFGWWAVEIPGVTDFAGFIGLSRPKFEAHFTPCIEIGWRLAKAFHGNGYATEGALACLDFGFHELKQEEILSFTAVPNKPSQRVMQKIGMTFAGEFDHPMLEKGHWLQRHVLYKKTAAEH